MIKKTPENISKQSLTSPIKCDGYFLFNCKKYQFSIGLFGYWRGVSTTLKVVRVVFWFVSHQWKTGEAALEEPGVACCQIEAVVHLAWVAWGNSGSDNIVVKTRNLSSSQLLRSAPAAYFCGGIWQEKKSQSYNLILDLLLQKQNEFAEKFNKVHASSLFQQINFTLIGTECKIV